MYVYVFNQYTFRYLFINNKNFVKSKFLRTASTPWASTRLNIIPNYNYLFFSSPADVYIPFLPLEQQHVRQCAQRNILERGYDVDQPIIQEIIHQVISDMSFWPQETPLYSTTGCKRVAQKVDELLYEHNLWLLFY